jgi:DNA-binding beta-propeller fold protein YncE
MTIFSKAAALAAGVALVSMTAASAQPAAGASAAATARPSVELVAHLSGQNKPLDASPDPTGKVIYFTTKGPRGAALFAVPADGSKAAVVVSSASLREPTGVAVSNDGKRVFVADRRAGHILVVRVRDGVSHVLAGTQGTAPRGLEIQNRAGKELVVYTGRSTDGSPAVLRIGARGAAKPSIVLKGAPLRKPDGVAISRTGAIYVTDHGTGGGRVLKIDGSTVTTVASGVKLGDPAGIALTFDESKLLVSSLNEARGTAQVLIVDTATGMTSVFDDVISANHSAGGLHRARAAVPMGWADVSRSGRVYRVDP